MKRFVKYVIALSVMTIVAMPVTTFAAEQTCPTTAQLQKTSVILNGGTPASLAELTKYLSGKNLNDILAQLKTLKAQKANVIPTKPTTTAPVPAKPAAPVPVKPPTTAPVPTKPAAPAPAPVKPAPTAPAPASLGAYENQVVSLVNQERAKAGLSPLKINTKLTGVAERKAEDLRDKNYFAHNSPTYGSPFDMMKQFGITYTAAGENIAKGQRTPAEVMNGWMNSPGHKANIMNANYTEIGVGYVTDSNGTTYWVQHFIRP